MNQPVTSVMAYERLMADVTQTIRSGILRAQKMLEYARVETVWAVGRHLFQYAQELSDPPSLPLDLYRTVSAGLEQEGLDMSVDMLKRAVQFHKNYPRFPDGTPLTWTHYVVLMRVRDPAERLSLEHRAAREGLTVYDLKMEAEKIRARGLPDSCSAGVLAYQRGEPYVYCIRSAGSIADADALQVDCGFQIFVDIPPGTRTKQQCGRVVRSVKEKGVYRIVADKNGRPDLYTYGARVEKVVDADTLDLRIDAGFGIWLKCQRVRLRGIDAPEMRTPAGIRARTFVMDYLLQCPVIVVRTIKPSGEAAGNAREMFGRWLVDVFALPGCGDVPRAAREGVYLNQLLLDEGHARIY